MQCGNGQTQHELLGAHRLFRSSDIDCARQRVAGKFCAHTLTPGADHRDFEVCHNHAAGQRLSLNYLRYGSEVQIDPGELTHFYLIQVPLRGTARVRNGRQQVGANHRTASVLNPSRDTLMTWSAGCEKLLLQIEAGALQRAAETLLGQHLSQPLVFDAELSLRDPQLRGWWQTLWRSVALAQRGEAFGGAEEARQASLEEELIGGLLLSQRSSLSHMLGAATAPTQACQVLRAKRFIHAHLGEPLSVAEIARASGGSSRNLQLGFKAECGCGPKQYLQRRRLDYAHYLLQSAPADAQVGQIAFDAGFAHLGRFSLAYRERFGVSPREALSRGLRRPGR